MSIVLYKRGGKLGEYCRGGGGFVELLLGIGFFLLGWGGLLEGWGFE